MTQALIFDVDGTLVDSVDAHARAWHEAFLQFGFDVSVAEVRTQIGKGGDQLMPVFLSPAELSKVGEDLEAFRSELWQSKYLERVKPFAHVPDLFEMLRDRGFQTAVASSCKGPELEHYLSLCHISRRVFARATGDDAEKSKPHPDILEVVMGRLGNPPKDRVWMVGDSPFDALAAKNAGIHAVGFLCGGFPRDELTAAGCVELFEDPEDLWKRFNGSAISRSSERDSHASHL